MEKLFLQVLDLSVAASWVILAVIAVRLLLRKAPKVYSYALWAVAGFRLVSSVSVSSVVSLFNLRFFRKATQATGQLQFVPRDIATTPVPQISAGIPAVDTVVNNQLPAPIPEASVNPMQIVIFAGVIVWLAGMTVMVAISVINYIRLRKGLRFAVRKEGNIWQCETVRSPFLVGIVKPKIYIPYGLDGQPEEYILAHENYHLKRGDHIVKLFAYALLTVHWFNPLCHLAFRLMNSDMEMSCDEHVLNRYNIPTTQYSLSLLTIATNRRFPAATPLAFAETGVKERMINVLNWKKPKKWVSVVAVIVCAILLISCATNPSLLDAGNPKVKSEDMLEIPGMKWGAARDEVKAALNLPEDNYAYDAVYGVNDRVWIIIVQDFTLFEEEVAYGRFWFTKYTANHDYALSSAELYYKDDADMAIVRNELTELYGAENEGLGFTCYRVRNGAVESYTEAGFSVNRNGTEETINAWWESNAKRADILSTEIQEKMLTSKILDTSGVGSGLDPDDPGSREIIQEYLQKDPAVLLQCSNNANLEYIVAPSYATQKAVRFDASTYVWAIQYFTEPSVGVTSGALLEFPGIKWGATMEEVKTALGVTEEQICEEIVSETASYIEHYYSITDFTFLGEDVSIGAFKFRALPGKEMKLYTIMLFLDENVDMEKMQEKVSRTYNNEGTGEYYLSYTPTCDTEWDKETGEYTRSNWRLKESKKGGDSNLNYLAHNPFTSRDERAQMMMEAVRSVVEDPEFKRYNWISPVRATEIMPAEDVEWLKAWHEGVDVPWEITQEWMEKVPLVAISMSNRTFQAVQKELEGVETGELSYATHNQIIFNADMLIYFEDYVDKLILDSGNSE